MPKLRESDDGAFELAFQVPKVLGTAVINLAIIIAITT